MENMKQPIDAVLSKTAGYRKAAHLYSVPQTTLKRHVAKIRKGELSLDSTLGNFKPVFSEKEEEELVSYIIEMEKRLFGLTTIVLRKLAYQLAEKNGKTHKFNHDKKIAGVDWLKGFLKRHSDLSIRKPEATSAARAMGFNKVAVGKSYSLLGEIYDKYNLTPDRIFNCDETGISCVSKTKSKIIAEKGRKQVGSLSSAERGQTVTVEVCFNAAGTYMPPTLIFPRQRMKQELLDRAPPGTTAECNAKGWITTEIFLSWFQRFTSFLVRQ
ncbi:tigger transposable element-derived protein 6-like [Achroia grisella]|uniref:tigger transposable element-derived protein 6-like n=1 Tax=Achroia grisella TaxID=688607 RepID=UPI0027D27920|nr:tigger transposable element-derived protein 6-like [Achroia grisella]XP_059061707.1 tigger transposable element-derived protein 6-like [Achroia grisella]